MEDVSSTHDKDTSPGFQYGLEVASALARLHVFGWGEERIQKLDGRISDNAKLDRYIAHVRQGLDWLLEATQTDIPDLWRGAHLEHLQRHTRQIWATTRYHTRYTS